MSFKVVVLSACVGATSGIARHQSSVWKYIAKPISYKEFLATVAAQLATPLPANP
jgi:DNA-binding response OmpR family regulator